MGIFVEEAAAFMIGGFVSAAILYTQDWRADTFKFVLFICMLILGIFGVLDVAVDHLFGDDPTGPQQATP